MFRVADPHKQSGFHRLKNTNYRGITFSARMGHRNPAGPTRFIVFNRWGEVVHFADPYSDMDGPWDGSYNGHPLPQGTYYYRLIFTRDDREEILEGPVYLLR